MKIDAHDLVAFEEEIKDIYLAGQIRAPVHLCGGNEEQLIVIFNSVRDVDWVFSTHRSHYHALLKGVGADWLKGEILAGRSISIFNAERRFFSSAIVGGCLPIALGTAMAMKMKREDSYVWIFVGDMAAETGMFHECTKYARRHDLPITFVIEDNGLSVNTPTQEAWGTADETGSVVRYRYSRQWPHHGAGQWVTF